MLFSAAAIGSTEGGSLCQLTSADTAEHFPILLKDENDVLKGSAHLSNCTAGLFCVDGSNVTLPHQLGLVREVIFGRAYTSDITFSPSSAGNITATVTIDLWQLTEAIQQLSLRKFCCVDGESRPNSAKCFVPELKCKTPLCMINVDTAQTPCTVCAVLHLPPLHSTRVPLCAYTAVYAHLTYI